MVRRLAATKLVAKSWLSDVRPEKAITGVYREQNALRPGPIPLGVDFED